MAKVFLVTDAIQTEPINVHDSDAARQPQENVSSGISMNLFQTILTKNSVILLRFRLFSNTELTFRFRQGPCGLWNWDLFQCRPERMHLEGDKNQSRFKSRTID